MCRSQDCIIQVLRSSRQSYFAYDVVSDLYPMLLRGPPCNTYATIELIYAFAPELLTLLDMCSFVMTKAGYFCRVQQADGDDDINQKFWRR